MNEDEGELEKFLYGDEYSNLAVEKDGEAEQDGEEVEEEMEEEEEEDDYEIILDSSKLTSNTSNLASSGDLNKRSLTSVAIGGGKGEEETGSGTNGTSTANASTSATAPVSHFDPFAPANLNGTQLFDHDLENFEDKPWRKPGADLTDYFNFGFNEVTWRAYCVKQKALREEFGLQKKIGVYDSGSGGLGGMGTAGVGGVNVNGSNTGINMRQPREYVNRRPPGEMRSYGHAQAPQNHHHHQHYQQQQQQQDPRAHSYQDDTRSYGQLQQQQQQQQDYRGHSNSHQSRDYNREYSRPPRSRHDSPSPPPPPPPSTSRHVSSRDRSRSRSPDSSRRHVSRSSRYDETPRSPPSKRRRD